MRWLVALALLAACSKSEDAPKSGRPEPMGEAERQRGDDACRAYVARLCKCAESHPEVKERCELKHAKIEALELALGVDDAPTATPQDVYNAQDQARKIIAKCIEENAALDQECP